MKSKKYCTLILLFTLSLFSYSSVAQEVTFGLVTDLHHADINDNGSRRYRQSYSKFAAAIEEMNNNKVSFVVELGDFLDKSSPVDTAITIGYLKEIESLFAKFRGDRYHVLGNHDLDCMSKEQYFSLATNSGQKTGNGFYSFVNGGVKFIVLDGCYDSNGKPYFKGHYNWDDANIPDAQLKWLSDELSSTSFPVICFVHQELGGENPFMIKNADNVRSLLEKSGRVRMVFQGHNHEGRDIMINGIRYYTLKGMIEGDKSSVNNYAIVSVKNNQLSITGAGNVQSVVYSFK